MPYQPSGIDPYYIPTAAPKWVTFGTNPDGTSARVKLSAVSTDACPIKNVKFRWLNSSDQSRFRGHLMSFGDRPGYTLAGRGLNVKQLKELANQLGLNESYVDVGRMWICYGESVLAHIPVAEAVARFKEARQIQRSRSAAAQESHLEMLDGQRGITPVRKQMGEFVEEKRFNERAGKPFVSMVPS